MTRDADIRRASFVWLAEQEELHSDVLPYGVLRTGFVFDGERVPLVGPQGIFKPKVMQLPLSITTAPEGPYDDTFGPDKLLRYRYRGSDPSHRDNVGLRELLQRKIPLVYFQGLVPGSYLAVWPVFVVGDDPHQLTFTVAVDDQLSLNRSIVAGDDSVASDNMETEIRRGYVTAVARRRIHQRAFRERVIDAYRSQCALCRLRHRELLDAAHIVPDSDPEGEPHVTNGIALCKLHHAAFDKYFISVRPDFVIEVRRDVLDENDGPMLKHGLQGMHEQRIQLPAHAKHRPDPKLLDRRHERFLELTPR